jgi:hypothetical protein
MDAQSGIYFITQSLFQLTARMQIQPKPFRSLVSLFILAVVLNYVWEMAQGVFYAGMDFNKGIWLHCFVASLGDGVLVLIIYLIGWTIFGRFDWFSLRRFGTWAVTIASGLVIGIIVEWVGVHLLARWTYTDQMPLVPGLEIGLIPILQMMLLPPIIFAILAKLGARLSRALPVRSA